MRIASGGYRRVLCAALAAAVGGADADGQGQPTNRDGARVTGVVFDSLAMRPLVGAVVQLATVPAPGTIGGVRTLRTDSLGRYEFTGLDAGTYLLGFQHVAVDSIGLRSAVHRLDLRRATTVRTSMAVPSAASIIRTVCGRYAPSDSLAVMLGSVRDAVTDAPLPGAFVSLRWGEVLLTRAGMERSTPIVDTYANEEGWYAACVPGAVPLTVRATNDNDLSGGVELAVGANGIRRRDLYVGSAVAAVLPDDSTRRGLGPERIVSAGSGRAVGVVRTVSGKPIAGARVGLVNGPAETRTNARGEFILGDLPQGTHTLEARALGYVPNQAVIDVVDFRREVTELVLEDVSAYLLDPVRVAAVRRLEAATRLGFDQRRRTSPGVFLDEARLDSMHAGTFKDLVRQVPGLVFTRGRTAGDSFREHVEFVGSRSGPCLPVVYLDGAQLLSGEVDLDMLVPPSTVRGIEVYHRPESVPAAFKGINTCGALVIWTAPRRD